MEKLELSAPQNIFLTLGSKFRGYVGGYGCVHPDTKIVTEFGLMRICEIDRPMRVLSWNESAQQFQLSLSGGAFPKGRANLYRVLTRTGEFRATSHHRIFSSQHNYLSVADLSGQMALNTFCQNQLHSILDGDLKSLPSSDQHLNQTIADSMGDYASAARQYGRQFLMEEDTDQESAPLQAYARRLCRNCGHAVCGCLGEQVALKPEHIRHGQFAYQTCKQGYGYQMAQPVSVEGDQKQALFVERICGIRSIALQSALMKVRRHIRQLCGAAVRLLGLSASCKPLADRLVDSPILAVLSEERNHVYYDMQVLDTNNYVDEYGFIHHNSGKTYIGCIDLLVFAGRNPKAVQGYFAPTYQTIRDVFYPTIEEAAYSMGFTVRINTTNKEVFIYRGNMPYGVIICRSMDNPSSIIGFKIVRAMVDEIDTLAKDKAQNAWRKIIARMRLTMKGVVNDIGVTTTPEGFRFVYEKFYKEPTESFSMVQASTYENAKHLPEDYISSLIEDYPAQLIEAYIKGQFVNMTSGSVYVSYDRVQCNSLESHDGSEPIIVGMDFNINLMAACIFVWRGNVLHQVDEIMKARDTDHVIQVLKERYGNCQIQVYPDQSGKASSSKGASLSDFALLKQAGFAVYVKGTNPLVKDRVISVNSGFEKGRVKVNALRCPETARCLEQQSYDSNGTPDKTQGHDHANDAFGYPITALMPITKPMARAVGVSR